MSINSRVVPDAGPGTVDVECETLDAALKRLHLDRVDILKIDTEGHELAVLDGAADTLTSVKHLVLEVHGDAEKQKRLIDARLAPRGLRCAAQHGCVVYYERGEDPQSVPEA